MKPKTKARVKQAGFPVSKMKGMARRKKKKKKKVKKTKGK
jgi:hypothetical protein